MQTVSSALNLVKAKLKAENEPAPPKGAEAKSFHQKERERKAADPENDALQTAKVNGKMRALAFLGSVREANHPAHEKNLAKYKSDYNMDEAKTEADIVSKYCAEQKASQFELADPGYQQAVLNKYRPVGNLTKDKLAFSDIFKSKVEEKWFQSGYSNDKAFVTALASKYGLTPNDGNLDLKNFELKS